MQIVIDIPEHTYNHIHRGGNSGASLMIDNAIKNGTPLPKGHGRLIDADDIDNHIIGSVDTRDCPTIIEADKD